MYTAVIHSENLEESVHAVTGILARLSVSRNQRMRRLG